MGPHHLNKETAVNGAASLEQRDSTKGGPHHLNKETAANADGMTGQKEALLLFSLFATYC
jgi:hypothetical protein